jgi:hypothetical protein
MSDVVTYRAYTPTNMRRDKRAIVPVFQVHLDGKTVQTANWSLGGLCIRDYHGSLQLGQIVEGMLVGTTRGGLETLPFTAEVIRFDPDTGEVALRFDALEEHDLAFFERCLHRYMRPRPAAE